MFHLLLAIIYLSFISLGLPDSLLGSAWPTMYMEFGVPVSYAGIISMIISLGTIFSSLQSDRLTKRFGAGMVTACSVGMTALALLGFSFSHSFILLCVIAVPYGLGAGGVDAALNNYVALHYASRHMSWLHCMWGIGASVGPYIMSYALTGGQSWNMGYRYISIIQIVLSVIIFLSLPLWRKNSGVYETATADIDGHKETNKNTLGEKGQDKRNSAESTEKSKNNSTKNRTERNAKALSLREIFRIPGAREVMITFFCYCALESTAGLWSSSYLVLHSGVDAETAAAFASLFYIGVTVGRGASGFITMKFNDTQMIRMGQAIILCGIIVLFLPFGGKVSLTGLILIGLGCAPVYPCIIHSTPRNFGAENSQAVIGVQMASAYVGSCLMPPVFGLIAEHVSAALFPVYLVVILGLMIVMHETLLKKVGRHL